MPQCVWCGAETQLYSGGEPICIPCDDAHESEARKSEITTVCSDRDRLLDLLLASLKTYHNATQLVPQHKGAVASAEATYKDCREVLIAHARSHGCAQVYGQKRILATHS